MVKIDFTRFFRRSDIIAIRRIAGELLLVPLRSDARQGMGLYTLNPSAALLWDFADGAHSLEDCAKKLCRDYDVELEQARQDLQVLLQDLEAAGLVELL